ncbi:MAG: substrate-binding domain-containing protein [Candidatus Sericytochromatia bacterium]
MNYRISLVIISFLLSIFTGIYIAKYGGNNLSNNPEKNLKDPNKKPLIGFSMDTIKEARWQKDKELFTNWLEKHDAKVVVQSANSDDTRQIQDIQSMITMGVDVLVIVPHNGDAMSKAIELAHKANIPVISYDRIIKNSDLDLYITFDNKKVGELQAKFIADNLPKNNLPVNIVRLYGSKTDNNAFMFKEGQDVVINELVKENKVKVVHEDWATDWKPEEAKRIMNAALTKFGHNIFAVLSSNDGMAGGAIQALIEEKIAGKLLVTGQDADLTACQRIVSGTQAMTIYKPIKTLAEKSAEVALEMAKRKPIIAKATVNNGSKEVPSILLEVVSVTKDNMKDTVVKDRFLDEDKVYSVTKK